MLHTYIIQKIKKYETLVESIIAIILMFVLFYNNQILEKITFLTIIEAFLIFIIILEVIRMVGIYLTKKHLEVSLIIDTVIIFFSRDILLMATNKEYTFFDQCGYISLYLIIIFFFFSFRSKTIELDREKELNNE